MSYLVFLGFFLLASIITSSGQTCNAVIPATARVRDVRRVKFYIDPTCPFPFYICKNIFTKAFDTWEAQTCVNFAITSVKKGADIVLQFSSVTGANVVATATAPGPPFQVTLIFDIGETWSTTPHSPPTGSLDLHSVALHLIGHGIGLEHIINPAVVMTNTILVGRFSTGTSPFIKTTLTTEDIAAAVAKYGPAC